MAIAELVSLASVCQSLPKEPEPQIWRDSFLEMIDSRFEAGTTVFSLEGEEGVGKTTLLSQFVRKHPDHAFALFAGPSRWACDPLILRLDLANQIHFVLHQEELPQDDLSQRRGADTEYLKLLLFRLRQHARRVGTTFYFVVDGLDDIPGEHRENCDLILDMLPLDCDCFRFLLSGSARMLPDDIRQKPSHTTSTLTGFIFDETLRYLADLPLDREVVEDLHRLCRGLPGRLAVVRRIVKSGKDIGRLINEMPEDLWPLLELEWNSVDLGNEAQMMLLAVMAHDSRQHTLRSLAQLTRRTESEVEELLNGLSFVTVGERDRSVAFVSESFRSFVASKLKKMTGTVMDLIIADLSRNPESAEALNHLPHYLEQANRYEDLLNYLSADHFTKMVECSQSLGPVRVMAGQGVLVANSLGRHGDLMRFAIQKSVLQQFGYLHTPREELEALVAIGDYKSAIALAQSATLLEDRLHMLAAVAKSCRRKGMARDQDLVKEIRQVYGRIDHRSLGERAFEIASDLIYSAPELASDLIEKAANSIPDENTLDWAFATLSIVALDACRGAVQSADAIRGFQSRIRDPIARKFSVEATLWLAEYSAADILAEVKDIEGTSNQLYLLRLWAKRNRNRSDSSEVLNYALKLAIGTTAYAPNARVLRELAEPLPFMQDEAEVRNLVAILDTQKDAVKRLGPTEDFVRLQLLLARTESRYDFEHARARVIDLYYYISELADLSVRVSCLAWFQGFLEYIDPSGQLEESEGIHTVIESELESSLARLLSVTADHYHATRDVIAAVSRTKPDKSLWIIGMINTEERRNKALHDLIRLLTDVPDEKIDAPFILRVLDEFTDYELRDESVLAVIERLCRCSDRPRISNDDLLLLLDRAKRIRAADDRCRAYCLAYSLPSADDSSGDQIRRTILGQLDSAWESIDVSWHKVEVGFRVASVLARTSPDEARRWINRTEDFREKNSTGVSFARLAHIDCLRLAIRSLGGLLPRHVDKPSDVSRLADAIDSIPSHGERAKLWSDLALWYCAQGRSDDCKNIVAQHVRPLLQDIPAEDSAYKDSVTVLISPALYCAHKLTALEAIRALPPSIQDRAYREICGFLLCKRPPADPYDPFPAQGCRATYEDLVDICELVGLMTSDEAIYGTIHLVVSTIVGSRDVRLSAQQRSDIVRRLRDTIEYKLPDPRNIGHDGYKVAAQAELARIEPPSPKTWNDLITAAQAIPNLADKALVLAIVATAMPSKRRDERSRLLAEALQLASSIPAALDRTEHYEWIASRSVSCDKAFCRKCLSTAMESAIGSEDPDLYPVQRAIVDLAYKLDPEFAASLASLADDDPARMETKANLQNRLRTLQLRKALADGENPLEGAVSDYPAAAWLLLGALNAGRVSTVHVDRTREALKVASSLPIVQAYPILAWVIENALRRHANTDQANTILRPVYEALILCAGFCNSLVTRSSDHLKRAKDGVILAATDGGIIVRYGDRETAVQFIRNWIAENVEDYLKIYDPYFGPEDLEVLQIIRSVRPVCHVDIVTSMRHQKQEGIEPPWGETYSTYWRVNVSDQDPPDTDITIVGTKSRGEPPIHDRWWCASGNGIRTGSSFRSLGTNKTTEISLLSRHEALEREAEIDRYLHRQIREFSGERLVYEQFTLR